MLVVMRHGATQDDIHRVVAIIEDMGYQARPMPGKERTTIGLVGNDGQVDGTRFSALPGVLEIIHITKPYKQVSREWKRASTVIDLGEGIRIGGKDPADTLRAYLQRNKKFQRSADSRGVYQLRDGIE